MEKLLIMRLIVPYAKSSIRLQMHGDELNLNVCIVS